MKTYFEEVLFNEDTEEEYVGIVDENGDEVSDYYGFKEGDKLVLLKMPFDKDGRHATGEAVFEGCQFGIPQWRTCYEGD